ncbi:Hypothetical predicted protein [Cloeon dipterum]|uniref:Uncharacterized protein n=1 Tax=Cloeon dipterum TaxID=197152 RepID=A0A8S1C0Y8_9INSE|nr:Hypothetical predicted protein [Cloeon dipterum]
MALVKKEVALVKKAKKPLPGAKVPPPSPKPEAKAVKKPDGKKKGRRGKRGKKGKKVMSAAELRRRELAKWMGVRPQLLAERIAQSKPEMPYFLQVEYALLADRALAKRARERLRKRQQVLEEKQNKEREHMALVAERHYDHWESKYQRALKNWIDVEQKRKAVHQSQLQKAKDISRSLFVQKQDLCKRFRLQEIKDKLRSKEESRVCRILGKKYTD